MTSPPDFNPYASPRAQEPQQPRVADLAPVVLQGDLDVAHHLRAYRVWAGMPMQPSVAISLVVIAAFFVWVGGPAQAAIALWQGAAPPPSVIRSAGATLAFLACCCGFLAMIRLTHAHNLNKIQFAFERGALRSQRVWWSIDGAGVRCRDAAGESLDPWETFVSRKLSNEMVLLVLPGLRQRYLPLPREFCESDGDWQRLVEFVKVKLPEVARQR